MSIADNKALVRRYKLEILNRRDLAALGEVAATDYLDHAAFPGQLPGLEGFRRRIDLLVRALDPQWTIHDLVATEEMAVVRWTLTGVHRAPFLGLPASGREVTLSGIDMYRIGKGRFVEHWNVVDLLPLHADTPAH